MPTQINVKEERSKKPDKHTNNRNILMKFGFVFEGTSLTNQDEAMSKSFTLQEIREILKLTVSLLDRVRLKKFMRKKFSISYWQVFSWEKTSEGKYYLDYLKHSWLER